MHGARQTWVKGIVEVDESYIAITDRLDPPSRVGKKSRTTKTLVAIAVEVKEPKGFGRVRIKRIDAGSKEVLLPFVCDEIEPGSVVRTDGSFAYLPLVEHGYVHERSVILGSGVPAHVPLPGVHRIASLLKRWLLGTHHGAVQPGHLDDYLAEFAFRFNRRSSRSRGLLFYRLLEQAVMSEPVTYSRITRS